MVGLEKSVQAGDLQAHAPHLPWSHAGVIDSLDHSSVRRGYEVYKQVCAACHSMKYLCYRHLVDVSHTEAEAKAEAEEVMVILVYFNEIMLPVIAGCRVVLR